MSVSEEDKFGPSDERQAKDKFEPSDERIGSRHRRAPQAGCQRLFAAIAQGTRHRQGADGGLDGR